MGDSTDVMQTPFARAQDDFDSLIAGLEEVPCPTICWVGISVGSMTADQAEAALIAHGAANIGRSSGGVGGDVYSLHTALPVNEYTGIVGKIIIQGTFPVSRITEYFGQPTSVTQSGDARDGLVWIVYANHGLAFALWVTDSTSHAFRLDILTPDLQDMTNNFGPEPGVSPALSDCSVFGPPPCIVATATPLPVGTVYASGTLARPAPGQPLRAVLTQNGVVRGDTTARANANGAIVLPSVAYGAYDLWLKHAQHLAAAP